MHIYMYINPADFFLNSAQKPKEICMFPFICQCFRNENITIPCKVVNKKLVVLILWHTHAGMSY